MSDPWKALAEKVREVTVRGPGVSSAEVRQALFARAQGKGAALSPELAGWADRVAKNAWEATAAEIDALRQLGHSEDAIFEFTVTAALGASLHRLERALALVGDEP